MNGEFAEERTDVESLFYKSFDKLEIRIGVDGNTRDFTTQDV